MRGTPHIQTIIRNVTARLVQSYRPKRIILFGSFACGEPDEDSDIDLLIVKETPVGFLDRVAEVRRAAEGTHPRIPFEPLVLTPEELEQALKTGNQFIAEIVRKGEVLYAA